jgi:hypothetical protein
VPEERVRCKPPIEVIDFVYRTIAHYHKLTELGTETLGYLQ